MGVLPSESHELTSFYETSTAGFGVLSKNARFYPSSDRIVEINTQTLRSGTWRQIIQQTNIPPTPYCPLHLCPCTCHSLFVCLFICLPLSLAHVLPLCLFISPSCCF